MTDNKPKCPICGGIGFHAGKVCICITGEKAGLPDEIKKVFGDIFNPKYK